MGYAGKKPPGWWPEKNTTTEVVLLKPPAYGKPAIKSANSDYWPATIEVDGEQRSWYVKEDEMEGLVDADRPGEGAVLRIKKGSGRGIQVRVVSEGAAPQREPERSRNQAPPQREQGSGSLYDATRDIAERVHLYGCIEQAAQEAGIQLPAEVVGGWVTSIQIQRERYGWPALPSAAATRSHDDIPF